MRVLRGAPLSREPARPAAEAPAPVSEPARPASRPTGAPVWTAPDYYRVLGVEPTAGFEEIARAYRARAQALAERSLWTRRASAELARLNAAYEVLRHPGRRAEYDRWRAGRSVEEVFVRPARGRSGLPLEWEQALPPGRVRPHPPDAHQPPYGPLEIGAIAAVLGVALLVASFVSDGLASLNLRWVSALGGSLGLTPIERPAVGALPTPVVTLTAPSADRAVAAAAPETTAADPLAPYAASVVTVADPRPLQNTVQAVTLRLVKDGQPVRGALVWVVVHYKTTTERWPPDDAVVPTNADGVATVRFNIGPAERGRTVPVEVYALTEGQTLQFSTAFTPRFPP